MNFGTDLEQILEQKKAFFEKVLKKWNFGTKHFNILIYN
jgi:hypothetical protein